MTPKPTLMMDLEVYRDYFLAGFLNAETGNVRVFEAFVGAGEHSQEDLDEISKIAEQSLGATDVGKLSSEAIDVINRILEAYRVVSFNGNHYDMPILGAALKGATCAKLKGYSDQIIAQNLKPWVIGLEPPRADHVDLFEVAPGMASLKIYGGRLHCKRMQDLPIHEAASIAPEQRALLREYNANDLRTTCDLWTHLQPQLDLREQMSKVYGIDLRSKSDAQIAEAVIVKEVGRSLGEAVQRPVVPGGTRFNYTPPKWITFSTPVLQELLANIGRYEFLVPDGGNVVMSKELEKRNIPIGLGNYRMGIGGLHSSEQNVSHYADDEHVIVDRDVTSYYPAIILNNGLAPAHMGAAFTKVYRSLVDQQLAAKIKVRDISGKIGKVKARIAELERAEQNVSSQGRSR